MADPAPQPQDEVETRELGDAIQVALQRLDLKYRAVTALVDVEGFSYEEAADILKIPVGTVKSRLARARLALRAYLGRFPELLPWNIEQIPEMDYAHLHG
jgi:RNA polymerase sigma-70 factor (ECF subfamily)